MGLDPGSPRNRLNYARTLDRIFEYGHFVTDI